MNILQTRDAAVCCHANSKRAYDYLTIPTRCDFFYDFFYVQQAITADA